MPKRVTASQRSAASARAIAGINYRSYAVYDNFVDANDVTIDNHIPDRDKVGTGWIWAGTSGGHLWEIQNNQLEDPNNGPGEQNCMIDTGLSDFTMEAFVTREANGSIPWQIFRATGVNANQWFFFYHGTAFEWRLYKYEGSYVNMLALAEPANSDMVRLKVVCLGDDIECFVNGVSKLALTHTYNNDKTFAGIGANTPRDNTGEVEWWSVRP